MVAKLSAKDVRLSDAEAEAEQSAVSDPKTVQHSAPSGERSTRDKLEDDYIAQMMQFHVQLKQAQNAEQLLRDDGDEKHLRGH